MSRSEPEDPEKTPQVPSPSGEFNAEAAVDDAVAAERKVAAENYDRYVRTLADLENYRRRAVREKEELRLYAASRVIEDLLAVVDNLSLGLNAARQPNADLKSLVGGVELVLQQLKTALASHGLTEINPVGKPFDPHAHEAISHQADATVPAENVLHVVRPGYSLNGRLIRPASVVVSSGPDSASGGPAADKSAKSRDDGTGKRAP